MSTEELQTPVKRSKKGLILGICAGVLVLVAAAVVFLLSYFSADAKFDRAMRAGDLEGAEAILQNETLKSSEKNDAHYLTLSDAAVEAFRQRDEDCETAIQEIGRLRSMDLFSKDTRDQLDADWKTVLREQLADILDSYQSKKLDYASAMQRLSAVENTDFPDAEARGEIKTAKETVIEAHLSGIFDSYAAKQLRYEDAVQQIRDSMLDGDRAAEPYIDEFLEKTDKQREQFYADAVGLITDPESEHTPEEILTELAPLNDYQSASALRGFYTAIRDANGVEAARLLLEFREAVDSSGDDADPAASSDVSERMEEAVFGCFDEELSRQDHVGRLEQRIGLDYVRQLFGDDSGKITTLFGVETSRALSLGRELDLDWFESCQGGSGKILYLAHYLSDSSYEPYDSFYYYRYENCKDIPFSRMPESLEDVEYLVLYEEGGNFYSSYSSGRGDTVRVYTRTIQVKVLRFPSGEVIYDSGVLTGPTPKSTITVSSGTKFAYGDDPDLSDVTAKVKELLQLT